MAIRTNLILALTAGLFLSACGMIAEQAKPFTSQKSNFSITFPSGSKEPKEQKPASAANENDTTYMTTNDSGAYWVKIINWPELNAGEPVEDDLVGAGASMEIPADPETKQITFQGKPAIDSIGWAWSENSGADGSLVKLQKRLIGYRADKDTVFLIEMKTDKKEKLTTKEANDYFNSFKYTKAGS